MKGFINFVLIISMFFSNVTFADCKWAEGVKKVEGGYLYSNECHGRVGKMVQDLEDRETEVVNLRKGLELKDLVIQKADERIISWRNESYEQYDRLQKEIDHSRKNDMLWFALGIFVTGAAVWGAGHLR